MQKLKISNLPRWISEIHLKQFFNSCGRIEEANIALDKNTLRPLGYGYITFIDEAAINNALAKSGALLDGYAIDVQIDTGITEILPEEEAVRDN